MLGFGNANRRFLPFLKQETYLDTLLPELMSYPYPDANSQAAVDEINQLINYTNSISENEEAQKRYKIYDENLESYIINVLSNTIPNSKDEIQELVKNIHNDIVPLIIKLKYSYQRIRPKQLSYIFNMYMYPYFSQTADTPSYPSGHSIQAKIYCEILGNKFPKYYKQLQELARDISESRLYLGLHYESDCKFAEYVSTIILSHPEFKTKYKL